MDEKKYVVVFDFATNVHEDMSDFILELGVQPHLGMNIFLDDKLIEFPEDLETDGYFNIEELDYLVSDDVFVATLKNQFKF